MNTVCVFVIILILCGEKDVFFLFGVFFFLVRMHCCLTGEEYFCSEVIV